MYGSGYLDERKDFRIRIIKVKANRFVDQWHTNNVRAKPSDSNMEYFVCVIVYPAHKCWPYILYTQILEIYCTNNFFFSIYEAHSTEYITLCLAEFCYNTNNGNCIVACACQVEKNNSKTNRLLLYCDNVQFISKSALLNLFESTKYPTF